MPAKSPAQRRPAAKFVGIARRVDVEKDVNVGQKAPTASAQYETESHRYDFRQRNNLKQNRDR